MGERGLVRLAAAGSIAAAAALWLAIPGAAGEGLQRDSDDYVCHNGALDDGRTMAACSRLRGRPMGADEIAAEREGGLQRDSDDYVCHHGALNDRRTIDACSWLRGQPMSAGAVAAERQGSLQRDSDDYNCHHGFPGATGTVAACARLYGWYSVNRF